MATLTVSRMTRSCRLYPLSLTRDNLEIIPSHIHGHPTFDASACILLFPHHDPRIICLLCNQQFPRQRLHSLCLIGLRPPPCKPPVIWCCTFIVLSAICGWSPFATLLSPGVHLLCCYRSLPSARVVPCGRRSSCCSCTS